MYVRKDYSIIALAEAMKRGGDQRKARFERSLSGMTLLKKIRQLAVHQNQQAPVAISLFYAKEVHNAGSNWDLQEETPLYIASIGRSRFVPPKMSSQHRCKLEYFGEFLRWMHPRNRSMSGIQQ